MKNQLIIILIAIIFMSSFVLLHVGKLEIFAQKEIQNKSTANSSSKIFKDVQGSVVQITRENKEASTGPPGDKNVTSLGSGFVFDKDGRIITNHHVVDDSKNVDVTFIDGNRYVASVLGSDPFNDIAVIKIKQNISGLRPIPLGNSSAVEVGDQVIAIGNPYGLAGSMSLGIVSQKGRLISTEGSQFSIPSVIQTDALINPGNSGGPLSIFMKK